MHSIAAILLILAALLWFTSIFALAGMLSNDRLARRVAKACAIYLSLGTWSLVLGLAFIATIVTGPPALAASASLGALCGVFALFCTTDVLTSRGGSAWLILPNVLSPAAIGWLVSGALFPRLSGLFSAPHHLWLCAAGVAVASAFVIPSWLTARRSSADQPARVPVLKSRAAVGVLQ